MTRSAIFELAAADRAGSVCAAFNQTTVQVWDLSRQFRTIEFDAYYASGAATLAFHPNGTLLVAGISKRSGTIAAYDVSSGALLWKRTKVCFPSYFRFDVERDHITWTVDHKAIERVEVSTGQTVEITRTVNRCFHGPNGRSVSALKKEPKYLIQPDNASGGKGIPIDRLTFAPLDVAFGEDCFFITESGGPVRCIESTGRERWRFVGPSGSHVLRLHYSPLHRCVYGVLLHYETGLFRRLIRCSCETGAAETVCVLENSWCEAFVENLHQMITSAGLVIDLADGSKISTLAFPQWEGPLSIVV